MRSLIVLCIFLVTYGLMHLFFFRRVRACFPRLGRRRLLACLIFLGLAPILVRLLEGLVAWPAIVQPLAWLAFLWMGFLFLFICLAGPIEILALGLPLLGKVPRSRFLVSTCLTLVLCCYGWQSARQPQIEEILLDSDKLPLGTEELRLVQITDLHLGLLNGSNELQRVIDLVKKARPDLLLCTGDLVDGPPTSLRDLSDSLSRTKAPLGKFAVLGNHEYYRGLGASIHFLEQAGFSVLRGTGHRLLLPATQSGQQAAINIVGQDDTVAFGSSLEEEKLERHLLARPAEGDWLLFLKHRPRLPTPGARLADLQLAGHTHQGQIFPFGLLVRLVFPIPPGLKQVADGKFLYTSRGAGTWGPPLRLLAPPEITLFRLRPGQTNGGNAKHR